MVTVPGSMICRTRLRGHAELYRPVHRPAGEQPDNPAVLHHREPLVSHATHPLAGLRDGRVGRDDLGHPPGHNLPDGHRGPDDARQQIQKFLPDRLQGPVPDEGRGGAGVSAAPEVGCDGRHIYVVGGGPGNHLDVAVQPDQDEEGRRLQKVPQFVGQGGDFLLVVPSRLCAGDNDDMAADAMGGHRFQQPLIKFLLGRGEGIVQELPRKGEVGPLLHQPGRRPRIARRRGHVREVARILVDAQEEERCLHGGERHPPTCHLLHQKRRRRPHRFPLELPARTEFPAQWVVVYDEDSGVRMHPLHSGQRLGIHQNHPSDLPPREVLGIDEGEYCAVERKKGADVPVDPARQDGRRVGEQPMRRQQGRNGIKIGVLVGQDEFHVRMAEWQNGRMTE